MVCNPFFSKRMESRMGLLLRGSWAVIKRVNPAYQGRPEARLSATSGRTWLLGQKYSPFFSFFRGEEAARADIAISNWSSLGSVVLMWTSVTKEGGCSLEFQSEGQHHTQRMAGMVSGSSRFLLRKRSSAW